MKLTDKEKTTDALIKSISKRLDILLASPENELVIQGSSKLDGMYYIQSGECSVMI